MVEAVDATVAGANANSYATSAEAATYNENHVAAITADVFAAANTNAKSIALQTATRLLDEWVDWNGAKVSDSQALRWPRYSVKDQDGYLLSSAEIPVFLKNATSELARVLLTTGDPTGNADTLGFSELKVGPLELKVDKADRDKYGSIPDSVRAMVEPYGTIRSKNSPSSVKLMRT